MIYAFKWTVFYLVVGLYISLAGPPVECLLIS